MLNSPSYLDTDRLNPYKKDVFAKFGLGAEKCGFD